MSGPMVKAILDGRKTQTRRVALCMTGTDFATHHRADEWVISSTILNIAVGLPKRTVSPRTGNLVRCPYGTVGDRLWVRETFVLEQSVDGNEPPHKDGRPLMHNNDMEAEWDWLQPHYRATDKTPELSCTGEPHTCDGGEPCCHWKPSIFMPRWASRITLEITNVRVQRVQEISLEDILAEGISPDTSDQYWREEALGQWEQAWDSINAKRGYSWANNPIVWVIEFKKL